jgi:hypothetical protein
MKIEHVNKGICQWRATNGKPAYFVNWMEDGENRLVFVALPFQMYALYDRLIAAM